jgi:subtilisin family serine protease
MSIEMIVRGESSGSHRLDGLSGAPWIFRRLKTAYLLGSLGILPALLVGCARPADSGKTVTASESSLTAAETAPISGPTSPPTSTPPTTLPAPLPAPAPQPPSTQKKTVWVVMHQTASLTQALATRDWKTRGQLVYNQLTATAASSQVGVRALLVTRGATYKPFWIANTLRVTADQATIDELATRPDVARIVPDSTYQLPPVQKGTRLQKVQNVEWGLANIRAPEVWSQFGAQGDGIVVANIDTGVQFDHPALIGQYRGNQGDGTFDHNYNWFDPANVCGFPSVVPCDNVFHGTHTMGTMVGDDGTGNQIGVAPHAKWIAAKGCESNSCSFESLLATGQWVLAPTDLNGQNPRPDLRPHIVNNSWGGGSGDTFYQATVQAWVAAGIFPAFANGNFGPSCGSASSPGDYPESYGVGAYDISNVIAFFSGRGAAFDGGTKPDIAAPGVDVRSSVPGNGYDVFSGTSMATPHLAGSVALIWSASPSLVGDIAATRALLDQTAVDSPDLSCGGTPEDNNVFGEGRLDVFEGVNQAPRGPVGTLQGVVTASTGEGIPRALIHAVGPTDRRVSSDLNGAYRTVLPEGSYDVTASAFGFLSQTVTGVQVTVDATTEQNFSLELAPSYAVSGFVRDSGGAPIPGARVSINGTPIEPATTDANGQYSFPSVPAGEYQVTAQAGGCYESQTSTLVVSEDQTLDFSLPQRVDAFGYSCQPTAYEFIEAETVLPLFGQFGSTSVSLPFAFPFYGQLYSTATVTTGGYLTFQFLPFPFLFHGPIPDPNIPNAAIYGFWNENLFVDGVVGSIRTQTVGTAPNRRFVIEWRDVGLPEGPDMRVRFEIVLFETGQIVTQYHTAEPEFGQRGGSATIGIENELGSVATQYSFNQPTLSSGLAVLYTVPPSGIVRGTVTDANDGAPIAGAELSLLRDGVPAYTTLTAADGTYQFIQVLVGDYTLAVTARNYGAQQAAITVVENATVERNFVLRTARATITPPNLQLIVPTNQTRTRTLTLGNTGSAVLDFVVHEAGGARQSTVATVRVARNAAADPHAPTTRALFAPGLTVAGLAPMAAGDIIRSFAPTGMQLAWGVGYTGNVWLGDFFGQRDVEFTTDGALTGGGWSTPWSNTIADMAYVPGRNLLCQVNVVNDNGIYCLDPSNGNVVQSITGPFQWALNSQRGLAYRSDDDSFYIGGWNEGVIYHIKGLSDPNPGEIIGSCRPADGTISGLAYNGSVGVLWAATNSPTDTIYELNPDDCTVLSTLAHPRPGFNGAGLEMDELGNLWTISQSPNQVYLIDSGVPAFSDVPWLSVSPTSGSVAVGASQRLVVTVDTHGLTPGLYLASVFIQTTAAREAIIRVPVSLLVPDYQQAVNAGGNAYTDSLGDSWAVDRAYTTGQWGYVQRSKTATTTHAISGTVDPTLFRSQRIDPYAYRFDNVPNGTYQIDLRFAELANVRLGRRLFDVIIEDTVVLPAHDIFYEVGRYAAESRTFFVDVTNGQMDVRLIPRAGSELPVINALRITHRIDR